MRIALPPGAAPGEPLAAHLRGAFPRYSVTLRGGAPILGDGLATGVMLKPAGPGHVEAVWAFPSMAAQLLVTLTILAGLLPGLVLFLVVWLVTRGGVARMEREIAAVLAGGPSPHAGPLPAAGPARATPATLVAAGACFTLVLTWLIGVFSWGPSVGVGGFYGVFWIALGVGAILVHGEEQRPSAQPGPGTLVVGVGAVLLALTWLIGLFSHFVFDVWLVVDLLQSLVWLAAGVGLLVSRGKPAAAPSPLTLVVAADAALTGVFHLHNLLRALLTSSHVTPPAQLIRTPIAALAWFTLAGALFARHLARTGAPSAVAPSPYGGAPLPPSAGPTWRADPLLAGRFHEAHPDDLQVLVHDGEPRRTQRGPEACWVRVEAQDGTLRYPNMAKDGPPPPLPPEAARWVERPVYRGKLLNQPHHLTEARQGGDILFLHAPGIPHPLQVRPAYLAERPGWAFAPCDRCGADQALDPPTVMAATRFPNAPPGSQPVAFTAFCPCGGTMMLAALAQATSAQPAYPASPALPGAPAPSSSKTPLLIGGLAAAVLLLVGLVVALVVGRQPAVACFPGDVEDTGAPGSGWATVGIPQGALRCVPALAPAGPKADRVMFRAETEKAAVQALASHVLSTGRERVPTPPRLLDEEQASAQKGRPRQYQVFGKPGTRERVAFVGTFRDGLYAVSAAGSTCAPRALDPMCPEAPAPPPTAAPDTPPAASATAKPSTKPAPRKPVPPPRGRPAGGRVPL